MLDAHAHVMQVKLCKANTRGVTIVMLPQVMMTRPPRRRLLQALLSMRSLLSLTLYYASWLRPLRYKLVMMEVMRNMIIKIKMKTLVMMMNQLRMNYLTC